MSWGTQPWGISPWGASYVPPPPSGIVERVYSADVYAHDLIEVVFNAPMRNNSVLRDLDNWSVVGTSGDTLLIEELLSGSEAAVGSVYLVVSPFNIGEQYTVTASTAMRLTNGNYLSILGNTETFVGRRTKVDSLCSTRPPLYNLGPNSMIRHIINAIGREDDLIGGNWIEVPARAPATPYDNPYCAVFDDALHQYVGISNAAQIGLNFLEDFTLTARMRNDAGYAHVQNYICSKDGPANQTQYGFRYDDLLSRLVLQTSIDGAAVITTVQAIDLGRNWHRVTVTRDRSLDEIRFYSDGVQLGITQNLGHTSNLFSGTADFMVGSRADSPYHWMHGRLDDIQVWDRALSPAEEAYHYANPEALVGTESGLVSFWKADNNWLDEAQNNTLIPGVGTAAPTFADTYLFSD
jgi:hypothetical protein